MNEIMVALLLLMLSVVLFGYARLKKRKADRWADERHAQSMERLRAYERQREAAYERQRQLEMDREARERRRRRMDHGLMECPGCGAPVRGDVCEYCGTEL